MQDMASHRAQEFPQTQRGKFNRQEPDGSVVIDVPSGSNLILPPVQVRNTRIGDLLAEGLTQNDNIYWTIRGGLEGPEIDRIYCDRIDHPPQRSE